MMRPRPSHHLDGDPEDMYLLHLSGILLLGAFLIESSFIVIFAKLGGKVFTRPVQRKMTTMMMRQQCI